MSSTCPTCGRRPSERHPLDSCQNVNEGCPDPIHDAADRYAEVGEEMERVVRMVVVDQRPLTYNEHATLDPHTLLCTARALLARLPQREGVDRE